MGLVRKAIGIAVLALYVLVTVLFVILAWSDYAHGAMTLGQAIGRTVLLLGLPWFIMLGLVLPEALFRAVAWFHRIAFRKPRPPSPS